MTGAHLTETVVTWPALTLAAAPLLTVLGLMLVAGWSASRAAVAALAVAVGVLAWRGTPMPGGTLVLGVTAEALFIALGIGWILWPALALHEHQQRCGAMDALRDSLGQLTTSLPLQGLLMAWFLALFLEGAAGFGAPVALVAPLLLGLGVPPVQAVVMALLGHAVGVSFGALGTPVLAQAALTGEDSGAIAVRTALLQASLGGVMMAWLARAMRASGLALPSPSWALGACLAFFVPCVLLAYSVGPEVATLGGALVGAGLFMQALPARQPAPRLLWATAPYLVLAATVVVMRVWPPLSDALAAWAWAWRWEAFSGRWVWLTHPGTLLMLALLVGARAQGVPLARLGPCLGTAARRLAPVMLALVLMLALARLMVHGGLLTDIQRAAVQWVGAAWPWWAPAVGALGSFVTGSATASNLLFSPLQVQTAQALGLSSTWMLAGQGLGAAVGNLVCPHNLIAGAATVGLAGQESALMRRTVAPCLLHLALGGALLAWLI